MPDDRMKKELENEMIQAKRRELFEEQQQMRQANLLMRQGKRQAAHPKEAEENAWKEYQDFANKMVMEGQKGYDSWVSALGELCILAKKRVDALIASDPWGWMFDQIVEHTAYPIGHLASNLWHMNDIPKIDKLPTFANFVQFTDDNKLNRDYNLVRSDGEPATPRQEAFFKAGIDAWLLTHHFSESPPQSGIYEHRDGHRLKKDEFNDLRDDQEHGLQSFLSGRYEMDFQHEPSSPRP